MMSSSVDIHVLLPKHDQLDLVAGLFDHPDGVVHVPRSATVDGHDLVVLPNAESGRLTSRNDSGHEDAGVLFLVFVEPAVDEGQAEAAGTAVNGDGPGHRLNHHFVLGTAATTTIVIWQ